MAGLETQYFYPSSVKPVKQWPSKATKKRKSLKCEKKINFPIEINKIKVKTTDDGLSKAVEKVVQEDRGYYFEAYSSLQSHEMMIRDHVRTIAYKRAIEMNSHLFEGKIVLDVGCGLGILSLFAASAGARKVIGIDASDITIHAKEVVKNSAFDNIIIVKSKVEELKHLPDNIKKVDIIISEWMGVCLYHESMLSTVLYARDKWLDKDGLLFPDTVSFHLACIDDTKRKSNAFSKWNSVCGFNLSPLLDITFGEPMQEIINANQVVTNCELIHMLNLQTASSDYPFTADFSLNVQRSSSCNIGGFVTYFDAVFSSCHKPVILTTSPFSAPTHWRQTSFYLRDPILVQSGDEITGKFSMNHFQRNFRDLEIQISGSHNGALSGSKFDAKFILR